MNEATAGGTSPSRMSSNSAYTPPLNLKRSRKFSAKKTASVHKPIRQIFGLVVALISLLAALGLSLYYIYLVATFKSYDELVVRLLWMLSFACMILFYFSIITKPEYLGGDPDNDKMLPVLAAAILRSAAHIVQHSFTGPLSDAFMYIIAEMALLLIFKKIYFLKDGSGEFFLCFKPWIFRNIPISDTINYNHQPTKSSLYPDLIAEP